MRDREPRIVTSADDDPWQSAQQERALATLWPLLGRHIAFHRRLVDLTANVKAALLLSQIDLLDAPRAGHRPDRRLVPQDH
jgi:hypothetical protein